MDINPPSQNQRSFNSDDRSEFYVPPVAQHKKSNRILWIIFAAIAAVAFITAVVFLYFYIKDRQENSLDKNLQTEEIVRDYIVKSQNFDGLVGRIEGIKTKISFSSAFFKDLWENELFIQEKTLGFGNFMIDVANQLRKLDISAGDSKYFDDQIKIIEEQKTNIHQSVSNLQVKTLENDGSSAKIQVNYLRSVKDFSGEQKVNEQLVYILSLIDGDWKIIDLIGKDGAWSETMDYKKEREDFMSLLNEQKAKFNALILQTNILNNEVSNNKATNKQEKLSLVWQETFESGSNWSGQNSDVIMISPDNAAVRMSAPREKDAYLFKSITVPPDAYYMTYDIKNEKLVTQSFFTVSFGGENMDYYRLNTVDKDMKTNNQIFFGDKAGQTDILTFELAQVGNEDPSVVIDNIKFYKIEE